MLCIVILFNLLIVLQNHFGIELLESEDGYEFTKDADITFLCSEFIDCPWFKYLNSCQKPILGPAIIRKRAVDGKVYQLIAYLIILFQKLSLIFWRFSLEIQVF